MALERTDPLALATDVARREAEQGPPEGWHDVAASVRGRLRSVLAPALPIAVVDERGHVLQDGHGSRTHVTDRVVEDDRLRGVEVDLVAAYGAALHPLGAAVLASVLLELRALLGPDPAFGGDDVAVTFVDVVDGDPRVV